MAKKISSGDIEMMKSVMSAVSPGLAKLIAVEASMVEQGEVAIMRSGDKITIPESMEYDQAITWIERQRDAEETVVTINHQIPCFPLDGLVNLFRAFRDKFGFTDLVSTSGFWGPEPPHMQKIETGPNGEFEQAPMCKLAPPAWEGGFLEPFVNSVSYLSIRGQVKRKFEKSIKELLMLAEALVRTKSIYKGKAFSIDLGFFDAIEQGELRFNPAVHKPAFLDYAMVKDDDLILNKQTMFELEISVLMRLKQAEACKLNNIKLKHGCLLAGPYGTGKTTAGLVLGAIAARNGWTFIYNKNTSEIVRALELARLYAPALLFCEDVDSVVSGERTLHMNEVLEAIDGIDAKHSPVVSLFTTNYADKIHPAFMRPGRIDTLIEVPPPDAETAALFILKATTVDGVSLLSEDFDLEAAGAACAGFVAATITEVVTAVKCRGIARFGTNIEGRLVTEDMLVSAKLKQDHIARTKDKPTKTVGEKVVTALSLLGDALHDDLPGANNPAED